MHNNTPHPLSFITPCGLTDLANFLEQENVLINKSCRFQVFCEMEQTDTKCLHNIVNEIFSIEHYFPKQLGASGDFSALDTEKTEQLLSQSSEEEKMLEYLTSKKTGLCIVNGSLLFNYCKASLDCAAVELQAAFLSLIQQIVQKAERQKTRGKLKSRETNNEKYTFRTYLVSLAMNGVEYKNTRKVLLRNLTGNSAWLNAKK